MLFRGIAKGVRQFVRFIRDGFKSVYHHLFMALSSMMTLAITLSLVGSFILFAYNTNDFTRQLESEIKIFVEFKKEAKVEDINTTLENVKAMPNVAQVEHYTKEEGYQDFINRMSSNDPDLATFFEESTEENPLVDAMVVSAVNVDEIDEVATTLKEFTTIDYVDYGEESSLSSFANITELVRKIFLGVVVVLIVLAVFLIQNTIKLTINSRRHELAIMRLVGASSSYVIAPFLVEGLIIGTLGAIIPVLLTVYGYQWLYQVLDGQLVIPMLQMVPAFPAVYVLGSLVALLSLGISFIGSLMAVFKFAIKV